MNKKKEYIFYEFDEDYKVIKEEENKIFLKDENENDDGGEGCNNVSTEENILKYISNHLLTLTSKLDYLTGYKSLSEKNTDMYYKEIEGLSEDELITKIYILRI